MAKVFTDDNTRQECSWCLGTNQGPADGVPCQNPECRSGYVDNRPDLDFEDEGGEHDTTIFRS